MGLERTTNVGKMNVTVSFTAAVTLLGEKTRPPGATWTICCPAAALGVAAADDEVAAGDDDTGPPY